MELNPIKHFKELKLVSYKNPIEIDLKLSPMTWTEKVVERL